MPLVSPRRRSISVMSGQMPLEFGDGFIGGGRGGDDGDVRFAREDEGDSFTNDSMVVDAQQSDRRRVRHMAAGRLFLVMAGTAVSTASIDVPRPAARRDGEACRPVPRRAPSSS